MWQQQGGSSTHSTRGGGSPSSCSGRALPLVAALSSLPSITSHRWARRGQP